MAKVEPLSGIDAAWLGMEDPTNLMMVSGIMTFPERLPLRRLKRVLRDRFLRIDRFRQRIVQPEIPSPARPLMPAYWESVDDLRLEDHVHRLRLPAPAGRRELRALVSELMSTPLDFSRPLWEMHLIENLGEGSALVIRLHHCIADGMALVYVLLSIADSSPDAETPVSEEELGGAFSESSGRAATGPIEAFFDQVFSLTGRVTRAGERIVKEGLESLTNPAHLLELAVEGADSALAVQRLFLRSDDPETVFKGPLTEAKLAAWSDALSLSEVKKIKRTFGGTVNDVLVSAMTGGLRRYLKSRREPVDSLNIRATVPVNLRKKEEAVKMGNRFGLVFLSLPVGVQDSLERLKIVSRRMARLKNSREAPVIFGLLSALGTMGPEIQQPVVNLVGAKATAVMTNMIGPPTPLYLGGCRIDEIMFWVPQSARLGLGVSILSYNNKVRLGVATDASLVPDPERIVEGFHEEYEALRRLVREERATAEAEKPTPVGKPMGRRTVSSRARAAREKLKRRRAEAPERDSRSHRCRAMTKQGARCKNKVTGSDTLCHVHRP